MADLGRRRAAARLRLFTAVVLAVAGSVPLASAAAASGPRAVSPVTASFESRVVLVGFRPGVAATAQRRIVAAHGGRIVRRLLVKGVVVVGLPAGTTVVDAAAAFRGVSGVRFAEPDYYATPSAIPNDPSFKNQWGLRNTGQAIRKVKGTSGDDVDAVAAWDVTTGSTSVPVGEIDTGVNYNHPDLASQIAPGGWNFVNNNNDPLDDQGHGTQVAGIIGAATNNATGVAGVDWNARIVPIRVCSYNGTASPKCPVDLLADGIAYAGQQGLKVANVSINLKKGSATLQSAINGAPGTLFVVAAGNQGSNVDSTPQYPCSYTAANVICVGSTDQNDNLASFSNWGPTSVDLAAPGVNIYTTTFVRSKSTLYAYKSGTSYSTAFVTGAAALLWSVSPSSSVAAVRSALLGGVDGTSGLAGKVATGGRLDILASLNLIQSNP